MPKIPFAFCAALAAAALPAAAHDDIAMMIGPMLHYNFGEDRASQWSLAVEASVWNVHDLPYGADFGIEYEAGGLYRLYAEAQTGVFLGGVSAGPVVEFAPDGIRGGIQGGPWINWFVGADVRGRKLAGRPVTAAPGFYGKLPLRVPKQEF